jgi:hypothetical protein
MEFIADPRLLDQPVYAWDGANRHGTENGEQLDPANAPFPPNDAKQQQACEDDPDDRDKVGVETEDVAHAKHGKGQSAPAVVGPFRLNGRLAKDASVAQHPEAWQKRQEEEQAIGAGFLAVIHVRAPYREQRRSPQAARRSKSEPADQIDEADRQHARDDRDRAHGFQRRIRRDQQLVNDIVEGRRRIRRQQKHVRDRPVRQYDRQGLIGPESVGIERGHTQEDCNDKDRSEYLPMPRSHVALDQSRHRRSAKKSAV